MANSSPAAPGRRILVVDDNEGSAESLTILLSLAGNETDTAYDGLEPMEAATTFRPDVILLDIGLPKGIATKWPAATECPKSARAVPAPRT